MFLLFPNIHLPFLIFHNNLHSNMFLLFPGDTAWSESSSRIYIPICFYYFILTGKSMLLLKKFTFQYVSIISGPDGRLIAAVTSFTFQYVSIISTLPTNPYTILAHLHSNMFLLFHRMTLRLRKMTINLHSNMFLLFLENPWLTILL